MKKKPPKRTAGRRLAPVTLLSCPFCDCQMGYINMHGFYRYYGDHKSMCPLECNPSASYGRLESLVQEWNKRLGQDNNQAHPQPGGGERGRN